MRFQIFHFRIIPQVVQNIWKWLVSWGYLWFSIGQVRDFMFFGFCFWELKVPLNKIYFLFWVCSAACKIFNISLSKSLWTYFHTCLTKSSLKVRTWSFTFTLNAYSGTWCKHYMRSCFVYNGIKFLKRINEKLIKDINRKTNPFFFYN